MKFTSIVCAAVVLAAGLIGPARAAENKDTSQHIVCMEVYQPVCGRKGKVTKTYSNACFAKADGATVLAQGPCQPNSKK
jgi:Kazal-type serine protease inhibitor domain